MWREIGRRLPCADLIYLAAQAHCPYGARPVQDIRALAESITAFLIDCGADVVVVACNTASAAALHDLRERFEVPIVGMEPAIKPAVACTRTGHVGVIATQGTFQGELFASLLTRFAHGITVHTQVCPGLVEQVEKGSLEGGETTALLRRFLQPLLDAQVDTLVLGCTHYPFLRPTITCLVGAGVTIIDPGPAVARQTVRVLGLFYVDGSRNQRGRRILYTTGSIEPFHRSVVRLLGQGGEFCRVRWGRELSVSTHIPGR